jgi:hypothetical protein
VHYLKSVYRAPLLQNCRINAYELRQYAKDDLGGRYADEAHQLGGQA